MYMLLKIISTIWLVGWAGLASILVLSKEIGLAGGIVLAGLFGSGIFRTMKKELHFRKISKEVRKKPTSENIKEYIKTINKIRGASGPPSYWAGIRATYMAAIKEDDIDYDLKVELFEALKILGTMGIPYPRKSNQVFRQEREDEIREAGEEGERQVEHALEWLDQNRFKVFSDIRLSYQGKSQQFDTVIVGDNAVFNIETKNYTGDLTIAEDGNWYREIGDKKIGTENVNFQVRRHNKILNSVLDDKLPIIDLIVWTNIASIIKGAENSTAKVIKVDQLVEFVEGYGKEKTLSKEEILFAQKAILGSS